MYHLPAEQLDQLVKLKPNLVVIHQEAEGDHLSFASSLHDSGIKAGLAILSDTPVEAINDIMHAFQHVLVFSGKLGYHGGQADLNLLDKVRLIRALHPEA